MLNLIIRINHVGECGEESPRMHGNMLAQAKATKLLIQSSGVQTRRKTSGLSATNNLYKDIVVKKNCVSLKTRFLNVIH